MKTLIFISDFFANEVHGGSELYTAQLWNLLKDKGYNVSGLKSQNVTKETIETNKECFFIVSNFKLLSEDVKTQLIKQKNYLIVEHDHHYIKTNNPVLYSNLVVPENHIINKDFFRNAKVVFAQSRMHAETISKNLWINNVVNLGCNLWSEKDLQLLNSYLTYLNNSKKRKFGVMQSDNKNKGTPQTVEYCKSNNIQFEFIPFCAQDKFYDELANTETLVFFPQWMESYCRVAVEARILGCKLITNKVVGVTSEDYFKQFKGKELLDYIKFNQFSIIENFIKVIEGHEDKLKKIEIKKPKVSLITTFYKGKEYIKGFMDSWLKQSIEDSSELIIIDANSPENESDIIKDYIQTHTSNIKYIRDNEQITPMKAFNKAIDVATGEYIAICLIDDRMGPDHLEVLSKHLTLYPNIDLVYGDCLQTTKPNEIVAQNSSRGRLYEHSKMEFSKENMIKCLPGPMPMFRRSMIEKYGNFKEELKHAGDWELWLRCVRNGATFMKVPKIVGLYYFNPKGLSTNPDNIKIKGKEEREVFFEYKDVIGENNFNLYKSYFDSLVK